MYTSQPVSFMITLTGLTLIRCLRLQLIIWANSVHITIIKLCHDAGSLCSSTRLLLKCKLPTLDDVIDLWVKGRWSRYWKTGIRCTVRWRKLTEWCVMGRRFYVLLRRCMHRLILIFIFGGYARTRCGSTIQCRWCRGFWVTGRTMWWSGRWWRMWRLGLFKNEMISQIFSKITSLE